LLREHSRDSKNSFGSFEMGNGIISLKTVIAVQRRGLLYGSKNLGLYHKATERHDEERKRRCHIINFDCHTSLCSFIMTFFCSIS